MNDRQAAGERISDSSWVMHDLWDTRVAQGRGFATLPKKLSSLGVKRLMERAIWAQGLRTKLEPGKKRHPYQANHTLRKWFKTRCEIAGMKPIDIEKLMNHSCGISDAYYRATQDELLEDYLKAADEMLRVNDDGFTLQKQLSELRKRSTEENYRIRGKLSEREREIQQRQKDSLNTDAIASLSDQLAKIQLEIQKLKTQRRKDKLMSFS